MSGWAFDRESTDPLQLDLIINDEKRATVIAQLHRPDLVIHAVHPDGRCGYQFDLKALNIPLPGYAKVEVKASCPEAPAVHNSPYYYYADSYLDQLSVELNQRQVHPNNILIVGLAKSGTSFLAHKIQQGVPASQLFFEPFGRQGLRHINFHLEATQSSPIVTKSLFYPNDSTQLSLCGACYGKRILILRDPRDLLISSFFYSWNAADQPPIEPFQEALEFVKQKETYNASLSFLEIAETRPDVLLEWREGTQALAKEIKTLRKTWHIVSYEAIRAGHVAALENHLGFSLGRDLGKRSQQSISRLQRSSKVGQWRRWFTPEDVQSLRHELDPLLHAFVYDCNDWHLIPNAKISPSEGSKFMQHLFHSTK